VVKQVDVKFSQLQH